MKSRTGKVSSARRSFSQWLIFFCGFVHTTVSHNSRENIELMLDLDYVQSKAGYAIKIKRSLQCVFDDRQIM